MTIEFTKMNGAANDFVVIDGRKGGMSLSPEQVRWLCDRRRGVGGDGLIVLGRAVEEGCDAHMEFYNSDGRPAEMCGNGSRCAAHFAASLGLGTRRGRFVEVRIGTDSGPVAARVDGDRVQADMMDARGMRRDVPVQVAHGGQSIHFMIVGTRHAVVFVEEARDLTGDLIVHYGRGLRNDPAFAPAGANVNFASVDGEGRVHLRTYEKGVEAETHACGTGSVAAAVLLAHDGRVRSPVVVRQHSGDLLGVSFRLSPHGATAVTLEGPVAVNFSGAVDL